MYGTVQRDPWEQGCITLSPCVHERLRPGFFRAGLDISTRLASDLTRLDSPPRGGEIDSTALELIFELTFRFRTVARGSDTIFSGAAAACDGRGGGPRIWIFGTTWGITEDVRSGVPLR